MRDKIKHHSMLTAVISGGIFFIPGVVMGFLIHPVWCSLEGLGLALYLFFILWSERYELVCPQCSYSSEWDKTKNYCGACGIKLVFRRKQKVKPKEKVKPERVSEPCCSRGHRVYGFDKFCGKCGEKL